MILTLTTSRSLTVVSNGQKDCFQKRGTQFTQFINELIYIPDIYKALTNPK